VFFSPNGYKREENRAIIIRVFCLVFSAVRIAQHILFPLKYFASNSANLIGVNGAHWMRPPNFLQRFGYCIGYVFELFVFPGPHRLSIFVSIFVVIKKIG
jgi:hypothetical protein